MEYESAARRRDLFGFTQRSVGARRPVGDFGWRARQVVEPGQIQRASPRRVSDMTSRPGSRPGLEARRLIRTARGISRAVGMRARAGKFAAVDDQIFLADRPAFEPAL